MADEGNNSATRPANEFARIKADVLHVVSKDPRKTTFYVCKAVEVVLCVVAICLSDYPFSETKIRRNFLHDFTDLEGAIVFTSLYGFTLVNAVLVLSYVLGEQLPKKMLMIFSGAAAVLCCITGVLLIVEVKAHEDDIIPARRLEQLLPSGIVAIVASLTFGLDTLLTYKYFTA